MWRVTFNFNCEVVHRFQTIIMRYDHFPGCFPKTCQVVYKNCFSFSYVWRTLTLLGRKDWHKIAKIVISHSISVFPIAWPFCLFSPISTRPYENSQLELKSYRYFRAKLKNVLWSGDLKASLSYSSEKLIYKSTYHASKEISEFSY